MGGKAYGEGISRYTAYTTRRDYTDSYRSNKSYRISTNREDFVDNLEYNGYTTINGSIYSNGGSGHYNVYQRRTSDGFGGAEYVRSKRNKTKYSLGAPDL